MTQPTPQECLAAFDEIAHLLLAGEADKALKLAKAMGFDLAIALCLERKPCR